MSATVSAARAPGCGCAREQAAARRHGGAGERKLRASVSTALKRFHCRGRCANPAARGNLVAACTNIVQGEDECHTRVIIDRAPRPAVPVKRRPRHTAVHVVHAYHVRSALRVQCTITACRAVLREGERASESPDGVLRDGETDVWCANRPSARQECRINPV